MEYAAAVQHIYMSPTHAPAPTVDAGADRPLDASPHRANEHPLTALSKLLAR